MHQVRSLAIRQRMWGGSECGWGREQSLLHFKIEVPPARGSNIYADTTRSGVVVLLRYVRVVLSGDFLHGLIFQ